MTKIKTEYANWNATAEAKAQHRVTCKIEVERHRQADIVLAFMEGIAQAQKYIGYQVGLQQAQNMNCAGLNQALGRSGTSGLISSLLGLPSVMEIRIPQRWPWEK